MSDDGQTPPLLAYVTVSSPNADRLREFYAALLALEVSFHEGAFAVLGDGPTRPVRLAFQQVHDKAISAVHVDLHVSDLDAAADAVVALGGTLGERYEEVGSVWRQAFDPDGNVFCLMTQASAD